MGMAMHSHFRRRYKNGHENPFDRSPKKEEREREKRARNPINNDFIMLIVSL